MVGVRSVTPDGYEVVVRLRTCRRNKRHPYIFVRIEQDPRIAMKTVCPYHTMEEIFPSIPTLSTFQAWPVDLHPGLQNQDPTIPPNPNSVYHLITVTPTSLEPALSEEAPHITPGMWSLIATPVPLALGLFVTCQEIGSLLPFVAGLIQGVRVVEKTWVELFIQVHPNCITTTQDSFIHLAVPVTHISLKRSLRSHIEHHSHRLTDTLKELAELPEVTPLSPSV